MSATRRPAPMTVDAFWDWQPPDRADHRWQLVDGVPVCMAPPSVNHALIQSEAAYLLTGHLRAHRPLCRVATGAGVIPRLRAHINHRVPDLAVTCAAHPGRRAMTDPVLLVEILSPSNEDLTWANVWAYATIPSVREILVLHSERVAAELLWRGTGGDWPSEPMLLGAADALTLESVGFHADVAAFYRTVV